MWATKGHVDPWAYQLNVGIAQVAGFQGGPLLPHLCDTFKNIVYRFTTLQTVIF